MKHSPKLFLHTRGHVRCRERKALEKAKEEAKIRAELWKSLQSGKGAGTDTGNLGGGGATASSAPGVTGECWFRVSCCS